MKRVILKNIIYTLDGKIHMMNLVSFRRRVISSKELNMLEKIEKKQIDKQEMSKEESELLTQLITEKQVLSDEALKKVEQFYINEYSEDKIEFNIKNINVNFSYLCNYNCTYCYQKDFKHKELKIDVEDVDKIYTLLEEYFKNKRKDFHLNSITLSGGEVLLPSNIEALNYFLSKFHDKADTITMYTNGVNIMKYLSLVDYTKITDFQISLDGVGRVIESVNQSKGEVFNDILTGIITLKNMNKNIRVMTLLCEEVLMNLKELLDNSKVQEILDSENVEWTLSLINDYNSNKALDERFYTVSQMIEMREKAIQIIGNKKLTVGSIDFGNLPQAIKREKNTRVSPAIHRCNIHNGTPILFAPNGEIYWCACTNQNKGIIGDYNKKGGFDISEIKKFYRRNSMYIEECKNCDFRYACGGGCSIYSVNNINKPFCGAFKDNESLENFEKLI